MYVYLLAYLLTYLLTHKIRMIGLPCGEEVVTVLSRFETISERDRQTDGRTDIIPISISRVRMLTS